MRNRIQRGGKEESCRRTDETLHWLAAHVIPSRSKNIFIQIAYERIRMNGVRGKIYCYEEIGDRQSFGRALIGIVLRSGSGRFQVRDEEMKGLWKPGHGDLSLEQIARKMSIEPEVGETDAVR